MQPRHNEIQQRKWARTPILPLLTGQLEEKMSNKNFRARFQNAKRTAVTYTQNLINTSFKLLFNVMVVIAIGLGLFFALLGFFGPTLKDRPTEEGTGFPPKDDAGIQVYEVVVEVSFFLTGLLGLGMIFVGSLGTVAVNKQQIIATKVFCILLLCASVILLVLATATLVGSCRRGPAFKAYWGPQMKNYTFDPEFFMGHVDNLQTKLKCCGLSGETVYSVYPWSCCGTMTQTLCHKDNSTFHEIPCDEAGFRKYLTAAKAMGSLGILTALYLVLIVLIVWKVRFKKAVQNEQDTEIPQQKISITTLKKQQSPELEKPFTAPEERPEEKQ